MAERVPKIPGIRFDAIAGRGGMSVVWRAFHRRLNRIVAVKVMNHDATRTGRDVRQFMEEARAMTAIRHPGVVHGLEADCCNGRYYFVMEFVGGYTFASLLARKGHVAESDALVILDSVADALGFAWDNHRVIHCDIKPENLMVDVDGLVKIADLGLCRVMGSQRKASTGPVDEIVGTPAYMSPDQIYGDMELDPRCDVYSLGATLYHLVTGRMLFTDDDNDMTLKAHVDPACQAPDPRSLQPSISPGLARMLVKMCVKDRNLRYANWAEVAADSKLVQAGQMPEPPPAGAVSSVLGT